MIFAIPIATGQVPFGPAIDSIKRLKMTHEIILCDAPGEIKSQGRFTDLRRKGEAESRNKCVDAMLAGGGKYAVMQDRDAEHLLETNDLDMVSFMEDHSDYGAVSIAYPIKAGIKSEHVDMRCVIYRREVLEKLHFDGKQKSCCCHVISDTCKSLGLKYGYMDDKVRIKHL